MNEYNHESPRVGDLVQKRKGYKYPGVVIGVYQKLDGQVRLSVECTAADCAGMIHIFSPGDLEGRE